MSTVRDATLNDAGAAARLHAESITGGFLSSLGLPFLSLLYRRIVRSPGAFLLVAETSGSVVGMAAGALDVGRLYREFARHEGLRAGVVALPGLVRAAPRVWETWRYGRSDGTGPAAELLSVAVAESSRGRGIGRLLVAAAQERFDALTAGPVRVVTAGDNRGAIELYQRCGFRPVATTEVHRGEVSQVLAWR